MNKENKRKRILAEALAVIGLVLSGLNQTQMVHASTYSAARVLPSLSGNAQNDFLAVARSQIGYQAEPSTNMSVYWVWAGSKGTTGWCSEFVAWCANKAKVSSDIIPLRWSSSGYRQYYMGKGSYYAFSGGCTDNNCGCVSSAAGILSVSDLKPGDILLTDSNNNMSDGPDHTAIVEKVENNQIYTLEGNVSKAVVSRTWSSDSFYKIHGICRTFSASKADDNVTLEDRLENNQEEKKLSAPTLKKMSGKNKAFTAKWKKGINVDGYEMQYAVKKSFSGAKSRIYEASKTSGTIKSLKRKKTYYVRVRSYANTSYGKTYSLWSNTKKVKIK